MNLEIRLVNEKERALKNAELTIKLVFKDGKERTLPSRSSNIRGEVPVDEFNPAIFKQINFAKSQYQVRVGGLQTPWLRLGKPQKISAKHFRYVLTAKKLSADTPADINTRSKVQLQAYLKTQGGKALVDAIAAAAFSAIDGQEYVLKDVKVGEEGHAYFDLPVEPKAIDWASLTFTAVVDDKKFITLENTQPDPIGDGSKVWFIASTMQSSSTPQTHDTENVLVNIKSREGKALTDLVLYGVYEDKQGEIHNILPLDIPKNGIIQWPTNNFPGTAQERKSVTFLVRYQEKELKVTGRNGPFKANGGEYDYQLDLTVDTKSANGDTETNNNGWSTGPKGSGWVVHGTVTGEGGLPQAGIKVKVFHKQIGSQVALGNATTASHGRYRIYYDASKADGSPNILVKVAKGNKTLATSGLIRKAGPDERVDFALSDETLQGVPLYVQLFNDTEPFLDGKSPTVFDVEDVALLAEETNHNAIVLAHFVRAWDLIETLKTPDNDLAEPFFALTSGGLQPTLDNILSTNNERLRNLLTEAIEAKWVSKLDIEAFIAKIDALRADFYQTADSDLSKLLAAAGVANNKKGQVIAVVLGDGEEQEKWEKVTNIIKQTKSDLLKGLVAIWRTLEKDATVTVYLHAKYGIASIASLVTINKEQLRLAVKAGNEMPSEVPGDTNQQKGNYYVDALLKLIEERHPHEHFLQNLAISEVDVAAQRATRMLTRDDLNLTKPESLRTLVTNESDSDLANLATLYLVCPSPQRAFNAEQLMDQNILSSMDVIVRTKDVFRREMRSILDEDVADTIYKKSEHLGSVTTALSVALTEPDPNKKDTLVGQLFSDAINDHCSHCASTLSPSAYLLDLYRYLKKATNGDETGVKVLKTRRPDIEGIKLNCANTDTLMPYIDLTLELLENMSANDPLTAKQTTWTSERLRAEPEHPNAAAYEQLETATFPWSLGYSRELDRTKRYLAHLGVDLGKLSAEVSINQANAEQINAAFARTFGVVEPMHIALSTQPKWLKNWGVSNRNDLETKPNSGGNKRNIVDLSLWLHLASEELVALLMSQFVLQGENTVMTNGNLDWSKLDDDRLNRLQFIGRLFKQTDYSVALLDRILALDVIDETKPNIWKEQLTAIEQLSRCLKASVDEVVALWEIAEENRHEWLADALDVSNEVFQKIVDISDWSINWPSDVLKIAGLVFAVGDYDVSLDDLVNVLAIPEAEHLFSVKKSEMLLEQLTITMAEAKKVDADGEEDSNVQEPLYQVVVDYLANAYTINNHSIATAFSQQPDLLDALLELTQVNEPLVKQLSKFAKLAWCVEVLGLTEEHLSNVLSLSQQHIGRWPNLLSLPIEGETADTGLLGFIELAEYQRVNSLYVDTNKNIFDELANAGGSRDGLIAALGQADGLWSTDNLQFLLGDAALNVVDKTTFFKNYGFIACSRILEAMAFVSGTIQQFWGAIAEHDASDAQQLLQAKLHETKYWDALQQLNDPIRETCQDRLVEIILTDSRNKGKRLGFENKQALYEEILIDPEMSACFETSRIKQATASLQQLIQRVLLNLESISFNEVDLAQWSWRKNYRVWEANRKVFITPENWVEPELRDNKTELFRDLETQLLQGEVDEERAEKALLDYARGLLSISRMEMVATLHDKDGQQNHVFARTSDHPRKYYWATRGSNGLWGGWESIEQEIEGDHVLPVIYENRLFLFWLNLIEKVDLEHEGYKENLARIETSEEICRANINEQSRKIDDYKDKEEQYRAYADDNYGGFTGFSMSNMWNMLADKMFDASVAAEELLEELQADLITFKSQKESTALRYTYFECNLSWSQYDHLNGWSPAKRSTEGVNTIYEDQDGDDRHLRHTRSFWIMAKPNNIDLDIELRTSAPNADGKTYQYRLGLFEFDPVLESISAKDEHDAPKLEYPMYFTTILQYGQRLNAIHPLPSMKIDVDNQDQTLLTWDPNIGARAYPEKINGYNPSHTPFLFSYKNRSYFFEPIAHQLKTPLVDVKDVTKIQPTPLREVNKIANVNYQALSYKSGDSVVQSTSSPAFSHAGVRKAATPLGKSNQKLADGRTSKQAIQNTAPVTLNDWRGMQAVMEPAIATAQPIANNLAQQQKWQVSVMYHPFADMVVSELYKNGLDGIYRPDADSGHQNARHLKRQQHTDDIFKREHNPSNAVVLNQEKEERFQFNRVYPYSVYNWELFFHAPFAVAKQLTRSRKYEEAQRWLHFIFDPVSKDKDTNRASWRFKPFFDEHLRLLDGSQDELTEYAEENYAEFEAQVAEWEQNPFNPHAIARLRTVTYMRATFIAYMDNLLAWADDLFRRNSMESVSEAAQLYIHASQLIGPAPVMLPSEAFEQDSDTLSEHHKGEESVHPLLVASGVEIPPSDKPKNDFYSKMGHFCIPTNEKVKEYWDTIADRLFKIRHCMNIEGVERTLALYQPPIDPAMLVKAAAAGIDIGAVVSSMNAPRAHYRFGYMLQKAKEFAGEVRSLGGALLSALEKQDSEALATIRSGHELGMQKRMLEIKKERFNEAKEAHASLEKALFSAMDRRDYYQSLSDQGQLAQEKAEVEKVEKANKRSTEADVANVTGAVLSAFPQLVITLPPGSEFGGLHLGGAASAIGSAFNARAGGLNRQAGMLARDASNIRRDTDWQFQVKQAEREIDRLEKDQLASEIRLALAEKEIADQELQIANSEEADLFLRDKFTNAQLYGWMVSQLSGLHYQAYQLALDMAKQAEACANFELEETDATSVIEFTYWDGVKKGLLSGERLTQDLNRLDAHYIAKNDRQFELSKNISLLRVDASQLLALKQSSECAFTVPAYIFDLDYPGHSNRRIKSVSLTIPAIAGPYTSLSCELSLEVNGTIVDTIALSSAQNDSGLFQFDIRDERYLPFEGQPVDAVWKLKLPPLSIAQFDYATISDVILTINYTAKQDGSKYQDTVEALETESFGHDTFVQLLSMKSHFANEWYALLNNQSIDLSALYLSSSDFPYIIVTRGASISRCTFVRQNSDGKFLSVDDLEVDFNNVTLEKGASSVDIDLTVLSTVFQPADKDIYLLLEYSIHGHSS